MEDWNWNDIPDVTEWLEPEEAREVTTEADNRESKPERQSRAE